MTTVNPEQPVTAAQAAYEQAMQNAAAQYDQDTEGGMDTTAAVERYEAAERAAREALDKANAAAEKRAKHAERMRAFRAAKKAAAAPPDNTPQPDDTAPPDDESEAALEDTPIYRAALEEFVDAELESRDDDGYGSDDEPLFPALDVDGYDVDPDEDESGDDTEVSPTDEEFTRFVDENTTARNQAQGVDSTLANALAVATRLVSTNPNRAWEEVCTIGRSFVGDTDLYRWALGDLAGLVKKSYGDNRLGEFAGAINMRKKTLAQYRWLAARFSRESGAREMFPTLSFSHYRAVAGVADFESAMDYLQQAADNAWSVELLELNVKAADSEDGAMVDKPVRYLNAFAAAYVENLQDGWVRLQFVEGLDVAALKAVNGLKVRVILESIPESEQ